MTRETYNKLAFVHGEKFVNKHFWRSVRHMNQADGNDEKK